MAKRQRITRTATKVDDPQVTIEESSERYVRWRNPGRLIEPVIHGHKIRLWMTGVVKTLPESWTPEAEDLGLERVGYAQ